MHDGMHDGMRVRMRTGMRVRMRTGNRDRSAGSSWVFFDEILKSHGLWVIG
ncbi:MAG: hypothetical protein ACO363_02110 [Balneolaceae bacterium]